MIKPDWNIFKAKFTENPQSKFEWFCYLLFCKEFNKPYGIPRFINQAGIETMPITIDKEVIGWQAKFYDSTLSTHKKDIIGTIKKSKGDYSDLTKIIFYSNQDWGQGKGQNNPEPKIESEEIAKAEGVEIEWRTTSYFESSFVTIENALLAKHFFILDKSIVDLLKEKEIHSTQILSDIHTHINFNNQEITIDRNELLKQIQDELNQNSITLVCGVGGVGKTAVIKKLYKEKYQKIPIYIFKSSEFNVDNINFLFNNYSLQDFVEVHSKEKDKIIVIDSAEKLLDLKNTDPFKEFIFVLLNGSWKIIFTARSSYLLDLDVQFIDNFKIAPTKYNIENLTYQELENLSQSYNFKIPKDQKLINLIRSPFYLNEYLKFYESGDDIEYLKFKEKLWTMIIRKIKPSREQCFLKIAHQRADEGQFYVIPTSDAQILDEFVQDGILGYTTLGYFITHDIYEEWALEKIIESDFIKRSTNESFFNQIGSSLPIRRAFRNWISEKIQIKNQEVISFIEEIIDNNNIESYWRDETLVAVLLSDYSDTFFELFKDKLLTNNQSLLKRISFLLRIGCKVVDNEFFKKLGVPQIDVFSIKYVLTKPSGIGWKSIITFVYKNFDNIGVGNINFVLPIVYDWNTKFKKGTATKYASLIALKYYQWTIKENVHFYRNEELKVKILQTILYGASEIKSELTKIFEEVLNNKWENHSDPYHDLNKMILTKLGTNNELIKTLPEYILKIADLFWYLKTSEDDFYNSQSFGIEQYFCIEASHLEYFPSSAYQTPIYFLLNSSFKETINFILDFTNKTVTCFAKSEFAKFEANEIDVYINETTKIKQYICPRLYNIYRGTQVSPHVLESMHMALEKHLLEVGKYWESEILEPWLLYLISNSKSASISALVISVVLAFPEKTFKVASILFRTKEFFFYDTGRYTLDITQKNSLIMLKSFGRIPENEIYEEERIKACDDEHRKNSLENIATYYQFFKSESTTEEEFENRQKIIWEIFDKYYEALSDQLNESEFNKTWRLYLARIDRRKMNPTIENKDKQVLINFNPELDPGLKEYSEESLKKSSEPMKYTSLQLWASYKARLDNEHKKFESYETNPHLAYEEMKIITTTLKNDTDENFYLFNYTIPGNVCSVLTRDHFEILTEEERDFCKDIILKISTSSFRQDYNYQLWDGVEASISVLPILLERYPEEKENIKKILLITLFDSHPIGMYAIFSDYSTKTIVNQLWKIDFEDAQSLLLGYLLLKPKYESSREKLRKEKIKKQIFNYTESELIEYFVKEHEVEIHNVIENKLSIDDLEGIEKLDLFILKTAFYLIPNGTVNDDHKKIAQSIIMGFTNALLSEETAERVDYLVKHNFLGKFAFFILRVSDEDRTIFIKPFLDGFCNSEVFAELFQEIILAEDQLVTIDKFWLIWNLFLSKIIELGKGGDRPWYTSKIIKSYLFAMNQWKETANDWHTLNDSDKRFFKKISEEIGNCPSVLYSISKLLYGIGSIYLQDGISWISGMMNKNQNLWTDKLEVDTTYYLENVMKKFIYNYREKIKTTKKIKDEVLVILNFLIEKGSVVGYLLREIVL